MANEYGMLGLGSADRMDQQEQAARRASAMEYARLTPQQQTAYLANNAAQMVGGGVGGLARAGVGYLTGQDTRGTADKARGVQAQIAQALQGVNPEDIDAVYPKLIGIFQQNGMMPEAMQAAEKYESLKNAKETKAISRAEHDRKVLADQETARKNLAAEEDRRSRTEILRKGTPLEQNVAALEKLELAAAGEPDPAKKQAMEARIQIMRDSLSKRNIQMVDSGDKTDVFINGEYVTSRPKGIDPNVEMRAGVSKAATAQLASMHDAEDAVALTKDAKGIINGSTGSLFGAGRDKFFAAMGVSTPEARKIAQLKIIGGALLAKYEKLPGPVSDFEMQKMIEANGSLGDPFTPNETKQAAADQMLVLFNRRVARGKERQQAGPRGAAPATPTTPGVVRWGRDANGNPVRL